MTEWWKANGGPLALVVLGLALTGSKTNYGWVIVALGLFAFVGMAIYRRLPWEIRSRDQSTEGGVTTKVVAASAPLSASGEDPRQPLIDQLQRTPEENEARRQACIRGKELIPEGEALLDELWRVAHRVKRGNPMFGGVIPSAQAEQVKAWNVRVLAVADAVLTHEHATHVEVYPALMVLPSADRLSTMIRSNLQTLRALPDLA